MVIFMDSFSTFFSKMFPNCAAISSILYFTVNRNTDLPNVSIPFLISDIYLPYRITLVRVETHVAKIGAESPRSPPLVDCGEKIDIPQGSSRNPKWLGTDKGGLIKRDRGHFPRWGWRKEEKWRKTRRNKASGRNRSDKSAGIKARLRSKATAPYPEPIS